MVYQDNFLTYLKWRGDLNIKVSVIIELKSIYNCDFDEFFKGL